MARVPLPASRVRARRRRRRLLVGGIVLGILVLLFGSVVWLSHAQFARVSEVVVLGTETVSKGALEEFVRKNMKGSYGFVFPKDNILLYPQSHIEQELLETYPSVRHADLRAKNFHTVELVVVERKPKALWCGPTISQATYCLFMDEEGAAYAPAAQFSDPVYVSYFGALENGRGARQYLSMEEFRALSALVDALVQKAGLGIPQVEVKDGYGRMVFVNDFTLLLTLEEEAGDTFERFSLALQAEPFAGRMLGDFEYLDLRFGDKLYYKLRGEEEVEEPQEVAEESGQQE